MSEKPRATPVLIYDGDCGICREWVRHWRRLTGSTVVYRPYQEAARDYPEIAPATFRTTIQFIDSDGERYSGAAAACRIYRDIGAWSALEWLYRRVPGFAPVGEFCYRFFARRRGLLAFFTRLVRGRDFQPPAYDVTIALYLRVFGAIYFAAMASFAVQARTLIGSDGILPLDRYLAWLRERIGDDGWQQLPMLFWIDHGDRMIQGLPIAGCVLAAAVVCNVGTRIALTGLFIIYLSLIYAGQAFMTFQWDLLLLEAGLLAILLTTGSRVVIGLYRWLLFRFMFLGGVVKILSGDTSWRDLTALSYHFETQPLPTPLAWYAHHLPEWLLQAGVAATLVIELVLPFLIFAPRRARLIAACCIIAFQGSIALTGNYNFFNLLTIAMCLLLFDDAALRRWVPRSLAATLRAGAQSRPWRATSVGVWVVAVAIAYVSSDLLLGAFHRDASYRYAAITRVLAPCRCINNYGPFAVMTRERHEIVIEGSSGFGNWQEYDFKYKPGSPARAPRWIIPHQPRVDWQMWFAALGEARENPWFSSLLWHILSGNERVLTLFRADPFPDAPPRRVRALYYRYRFTTPEQRAQSGQWWQRELVGQYHPAVGLDDFRRRR